MLLVDDDELFARTVVRGLRGTCEVVVARHGSEALSWLDAGDRYDAILLDLHMPGMNGMTVYEEILHSHGPLASKVLFVTGGGHSVDELEFLDSVRSDTLRKPFHISELIGAVDRVVRDRPARPSGFVAA